MDPKDTPAPNATAPAADATPPAPTPSEDEFASAFDDLNKDPAPMAPAAPTGEPTPAATAPTSATPAAAPGGTEPTAAPASPSADPAPVVPDGFIARSDVEAMIAEALKNAAPAAPAPASAPAADPPEAKPIYTDEEKASLVKYQEEWPDVARNEALQRRAEYQGLVSYIFGEVTKALAPLQAATAQIPTLAEDTQYRQLTELIPDYDAVRDPVIEWVGKQPAYLKAAYEKVTAEGTPDDIADLVERFKKETGWAPAAPAAPAPAPASAAAPAARTASAAAPAANAAPAAATAALPAAAAAAAASLKPVKGGRTEPTSAADPNDFDSAWAEIVKA